MTLKSDTDDIINTSKLSDKPQNFFNDSNVSRFLYIQSLKAIRSVNLLPETNMSEKTARNLGGGWYNLNEPILNREPI